MLVRNLLIPLFLATAQECAVHTDVDDTVASAFNATRKILPAEWQTER